MEIRAAINGYKFLGCKVLKFLNPLCFSLLPRFFKVRFSKKKKSIQNGAETKWRGGRKLELFPFFSSYFILPLPFPPIESLKFLVFSSSHSSSFFLFVFFSPSVFPLTLLFLHLPPSSLKLRVRKTKLE